MKSVLVYNKSFHQKNEIKSRYPLLRSCFSPRLHSSPHSATPPLICAAAAPSTRGVPLRPTNAASVPGDPHPRRSTTSGQPFSPFSSFSSTRFGEASTAVSRVRGRVSRVRGLQPFRLSFCSSSSSSLLFSSGSSGNQGLVL